MEGAKSFLGRGRGRGVLQDDSDSDDSLSSMSKSLRSVRGRGRGRGRGLFAPGVFQDDPPAPATAPLRKREDPEPEEDSDDEDDFITGFRKLQAVSSNKPGGRGLATTSSFGRGKGMLGGITNLPSLHKFPYEPAAVLYRPVPIPTLSPGTSSSQASSELGSDEFSDIERPVVVKRGKQGELVNLCANFVRLRHSSNGAIGLFEYHVKFDPHIESKKLRWSVLKGSCDYIGNTLNFDGSKLYLPTKLQDKITEFSKVHPVNRETFINVQIKFIKKNSLDGCVHFYNVLLRRIMHILGMAEMNRNFYDYEKIYDLPIHKLQIWPGFVTAVDVFEGGLMLCCDSSFRVLRTDTMLEALIRIDYSNPAKRRELFRNYALRKIVLTRYNNKHYRVDDVDWHRSPRSTFVQTRNGVEEEISFVEYYKNNYDVTITDLDQPMLVTRGKIKSQTNDLSPPSVILLVPELCFVTGMTEDITSNYRIMKDIAQHTRISPAQRHGAVVEFVENVNANPKAQSVFKDWGLELESVTVQLEGRILAPPTIILNRNCEKKPSVRGDFGRDVTQNAIYDPIHVSNWLLFCTPNEDLKAQNLMRMYRVVAPPLGISYRGDAEIVHVPRRGAPDDFRRTLTQHIEPNKTQFVVVIIPSAREDLYRVIKLICNREIPVPSQVVLTKTLGDEKRLRSVMQKIALQINCKLGGALWTLKIPLPENIMFIGMDVYHDPSRKNPSVTGVVATLNPTYTKYYSRVIFQSAQQESIVSLRPVIIDCMTEFLHENKCYPDRIVLFRDGVGDGQLELTKQNEVAQILESYDMLNHTPKFTFCIVQKRINARIYVQNGSYIGNPEPGTVLDHTVTRRYLFDFFLVSQLIKEGTVNPTHYVVLYDNADIKPDVMQKFAYATSYMYYNWAGSIRVPAMCQYAHKLAGLVGQHLRTEPSKELAKKLYYL